MYLYLQQPETGNQQEGHSALQGGGRGGRNSTGRGRISPRRTSRCICVQAAEGPKKDQIAGEAEGSTTKVFGKVNWTIL